MSKGFNVSIVTETYPPEVNGVAVTLSRFVDGLVERGYGVQLIRPAQADDELPGTIRARSSCEEVCFSRGYSIPMYRSLKFGWASVNSLRSHLERFESRVTYIATEGPLGYSALKAAKHLNIPVISGFHTHFETYASAYRLQWLQPVVARYLEKFHNRCHTTLASSETLHQKIRELGINNIRNISRGIDTEQFHPRFRDPALRAAWGIRDGQRVVLFVSRLAPEKNPELLFRAFRKMRHSAPWIKLVVVGDGPIREKYQRKHPEVVFCGAKTGENLSRHYASADLFLFPSLSETYGLVVAEAMASALPVIGFDYAAPAALIESGVNGWLAPFGDEDAFIEAALKAAQTPESKLLIMREHAYEAAQRLSWSDALDDLERIFHNSLEDTLHAPAYATSL